MKNRTDLNLGKVVYIVKSDINFTYCHYFILAQRCWEKTTGNQITLKVVTTQETSDISVRDDLFILAVITIAELCNNVLV